MPTLKDFKFVDLKRSTWDEKASDPSKGRYKFSKKVYIKTSDYDDKAIRPRHVLAWNRWEKANDYYEFKEWERDFDAEAVKAADGLYWPEPLSPKADGTYQWKDSILMQVPLLRWLQKRDEDVKRYDRQRISIQKELQDKAKAYGANLEMMEDDLIRKIGI